MDRVRTPPDKAGAGVVASKVSDREVIGDQTPRVQLSDLCGTRGDGADDSGKRGTDLVDTGLRRFGKALDK